MGKPKKSKKRKNSSEGTSGQLKNARNGGSFENNSVSDSIHEANSVLYGDNSIFDPETSVFESK